MSRRSAGGLALGHAFRVDARAPAAARREPTTRCGVSRAVRLWQPTGQRPGRHGHRLAERVVPAADRAGCGALGLDRRFEMWKRWWPGVETRAALAIEDLDEVDVAVFENTRVPALFKRRLRAAGAALVTWRPSNRHAMFVLGRGVDRERAAPAVFERAHEERRGLSRLGWPGSRWPRSPCPGARRASAHL